MNSFEMSIRSNVKEIQKKLSALAYQQLPFATATALTELAKKVQDAEVKNMQATFKNPSPFTLKSVRITKARKDNLVATVFVMDKTAAYLQPYERGGVHKINSKAQLVPGDIPLNQYGQLRKGTLASLKARSDIYIGPIKTRHGIVNGIWQRTADKAAIASKRTGKIRISKRGVNQTGKLKLLIRFTDALPVTQHLNYRDRAKQVIAMNVNKELGRAIGKAMASAKG